MLLPAGNELGEAEFVVTRSACVAVATTSAAVALLFAVFGSEIAELTVAVSLMAVPAAVPALTCNVRVKVPVPGAKEESLQVMVPADPTAGVTQPHPAGNVIAWKFVLGGVVSVIVTVVAVLGPAFVTTCV